MTQAEAQQIIQALKAGKTYFKPLPYRDVEGGTTITYDAKKDKFIEHYLNRSVYDRGTEEHTFQRSEAELLEMFNKEKYTDQQYVIPTKSEEYRLIDPEN
ncbi:MAG: hypothetical protein AAFU64_00410 [Bacteroidota bacterium]